MQRRISLQTFCVVARAQDYSVKPETDMDLSPCCYEGQEALQYKGVVCSLPGQWEKFVHCLKFSKFVKYG